MILGVGLALVKCFAQITLKDFGVVTNASGLRPAAALVQGADGTLFGVTSSGELSVKGSIFKIRPDGKGFTVLKRFIDSSEGANPYAAMILVGNILYGTTKNGGRSGYGTVFRISTDGSGYTVLKHFTGADGVSPSAAVILSGNVLYGTTRTGGGPNLGTLFKVNTNGSGFAVLKHFSGTDGKYPGGLTLSGNTLYGTTEGGGISGGGTVFQIDTDGTGFGVVKHFSEQDGTSPLSGLVLSDSVLYGTTAYGSVTAGTSGAVFRMNVDGTDYSVLKWFSGSEGANPKAGLMLNEGVLYGTTFSGGSPSAGVVFRLNADGSDYTVLKRFNVSDGARPVAGLVLSGGSLYGSTYEGGDAGYGVLFRLSSDGTAYSVLRHFTATDDGANPWGGLTLSGGMLYGTTTKGRESAVSISPGYGTIFALSTNGTGYSVLKQFTGADGANPWATMILSDGQLFGTTLEGGSSDQGTVFRVKTNGTDFAVLKHFVGTDGRGVSSGLTLSGDTLFGTTGWGGAVDRGTVFRLRKDGTDFAVMKHFEGAAGENPRSTLVVAGGVLYGTTASGGDQNLGTVFRINTDGTDYAVLKHFAGVDGQNPWTSLVLSHDVLYGVTQSGGSSGSGTLFRIKTDGTGFMVLKHYETDRSNGATPNGDLFISDGVLYGTTEGGGYGGGTIFRVNTDGTDYTLLWRFLGAGVGTGGRHPFAGIVMADYAIYGTTKEGGNLERGTVFKLKMLRPAYLTTQRFGNSVILSWDRGEDLLQSSLSAGGNYSTVTNATSPYTNVVTGLRRFFRLLRN